MGKAIEAIRELAASPAGKAYADQAVAKLTARNKRIYERYSAALIHEEERYQVAIEKLLKKRADALTASRQIYEQAEDDFFTAELKKRGL